LMTPKTISQVLPGAAAARGVSMGAFQNKP
jgi:hypothetical protein